MRAKRFFKRFVVVIAILSATTFVGYRAWLQANSDDIEFAVLSGLTPSDRDYPIQSPSGPSPKMIARLRELGIVASRKAADDYGIEVAILPTGLYSARVSYGETWGSLNGSGMDLVMRKIDGRWVVVSTMNSWQS